MGSANWHDKNWQIEQTLGEVVTAERLYDFGSMPEKVPLPQVLGGRDCIQAGELWEGRIDYALLQDGIPRLCFELPDDDDFFRASSFLRCSLQRFYLTVIFYLYLDDGLYIAELFYAMWGDAVIVKTHEATETLPAVVTAISPGYTLIVADGTRNYQQWALESFQTLTRPQNFGILATAPLWYEASQRIIDFMEADGADPTKPIFLCGHSYGGVACLIAAARLRAAAPNRVIRYLTFGCPKVGNLNLVKLIETCQGANITNTNDLVTVLPPDLGALEPLLAVFGVPQLLNCSEWQQPPNRFGLASDGGVLADELPILDSPTLAAMITQILADDPVGLIEGHRTAEYLRRLKVRCPDESWPLTDEAFDLLTRKGGAIGLPGRLPAKSALRFGSATPATGLIAMVASIPAEKRAAMLDTVLAALGSTGMTSAVASRYRLDLLVPVETPGDSCETSLDRTLPWSFSGHVVSGSPQWFKFSITPGDTVHVTWSAPPATGGQAAVYTGVCGSLNFKGNAYLESPCLTVETTGGEDTIYVAVLAAFATEQDYTVGASAGPCPTPEPVTIFLTSGTTFEAPADWPGIADSVECIGGGGGGRNPDASNVAVGGGGGGYSKEINVVAADGCTMQIGSGGAANSNGGDTWFNGATLAASSCGAKGGTAGSSGVAGVGGAAASGVGSTKYSGGNGGGKGTNSRAGAGGGGAGGPNGGGKNGGVGGIGIFYYGAGGGGGGGGSATDGGASSASPPAGAGGTAQDGTAGGAGANATSATPAGNGSHGGGGGGGYGFQTPTYVAGKGGDGIEFDATHGAGGGGGGGGGGGTATGSNGGAGGNYGGGGGGGGWHSGLSAVGGKGGDGIIVIVYTPTS